jgi:hypothetical protein
VAWTVARVAAKSDEATPEAADVTAMVSESRGSGVAMVKVGSGPGSGSAPRAEGPRADGPTPRAGRASPIADGPALEQTGMSCSSRPSRVDQRASLYWGWTAGRRWCRWVGRRHVGAGPGGDL